MAAAFPAGDDLGPPACSARPTWAALARTAAGADDGFKAKLLAALVHDATQNQHPGIVTTGELQAFLTRIKESADALTGDAMKILDDLDASGDGKLQMDELKNLVFGNSAILRCLSALQVYQNDPAHSGEGA